MNAFKSYARVLFYIAGFFITAFVAGCGGGSSGQSPILGLPTAELVRVVVTPPTALVPGGGVQQFVAIASFIDGSSRDVTAESAWTSGTVAVATVNSATGRATGVATGTAVIMATFGGKAGSATLTVNAASTLVSIAVTPANPSIAMGSAQQFIALGTYSDGATRDITSISTFSTGSANIATVTAGGLATGVSAGSAVITATSGARSGSATVAVTQAVPPTALVTSIAVTPSTSSILIGGAQQFNATATYSNGTSADVSNTATWTSSNNAIATISSSGLGRGVATGLVAMTASFGGKSGSGSLTVGSAATLVSVTVTPLTATIATGSTQRFVAVATYLDGTTIDVSYSAGWVSSNTAVAPVLGTGVATGVSVGTTTITTTFSGKSGAATLTVVANAADATGATFLVTPPVSIVRPGVTQHVFATVQYADGRSADVSSNVLWTSSNPAVATVDQNGVVTALTAGTATIAATSGNARATTDYTVRPTAG